MLGHQIHYLATRFLPWISSVLVIAERITGDRHRPSPVISALPRGTRPPRVESHISVRLPLPATACEQAGRRADHAANDVPDPRPACTAGAMLGSRAPRKTPQWQTLLRRCYLKCP